MVMRVVRGSDAITFVRIGFPLPTLEREGVKKFGWSYRPDPVGTRCSASVWA